MKRLSSHSKNHLVLPLLVALSAIAILLAACSSAQQATTTSSAASQPQTSFTIIHTNDVHGYLQAGDGVLGIAAVAQLKADHINDGEQVLLLDAGDALQGNTFVSQSQGAVVPGLMNAAGYDAMALGNHDFDYGADVLQERMAAFDFPALAANITVDATGELFAQANTTFTLGDGTKVGVFGLDTPSTKTQSATKNTAGLSFATGDDLYACAQQQADELRAQGCDFVVCMTHLGENDEVGDNKASDVAANTSGIDVIIDAHDHQVESRTVADKDGRNILICETGCYLANIGVLKYENGTWTDTLVAAGDYAGSDEAVAAQVDAIAKQLDEQLSEVVGTTAFTLNGERTPGNRDQETNFGDFAADAFLWQAKNAATKAPDAAIVNGGGIRASIDAGDITLHNIIDAMPFDNQLCTIEVTGAQLLEALEASTQSLPEPAGGFPQVAGITFTVDTTVPYEQGEAYPNTTLFAPAKPGARVSISDVNGKGFDLDAHYVLALSEFVATGGDSYYCFAQAAHDSIEYIGYTDTHALQYFLTDGCSGTVPDAYAQPQGRITIVS